MVTLGCALQRRSFLRVIGGSALATGALASGCSQDVPAEAWQAMADAAAVQGVPLAHTGAGNAVALAMQRHIAADAWKAEMTTPAAMLESFKVLRVGAAEVAQHRDGLTLMDPMVARPYRALREALHVRGQQTIQMWARVGYAPPVGPAPARPGVLALPAAQRGSAFFDHFIDALRARPLTLEVMAAEIVERNELTAILEEEREQWGEQAFAVLGGPEMAARPHLRHATLLLVAGVQHLLLRSRRIRQLGGLDLHRDADWAALTRSVAVLAGQVLPP